jgi:2,3-dihydroxy-p-cumate/2,3-dihydroxybenzoate 3,4-dioxygenase
MIELEEINCVRSGTPNLDTAEWFATRCLGVKVSDRGKKGQYLRSEECAHTLFYG